MPVPMKELFINHSNPIDIGEFIGIFAEDGNYSVDKDYRHQIRIFLNAKDTRYIQHVTALMKRLFDRNPWVYTRPAYNVT
ncbi:MAG: hypothetical protein KGH72_05805, partial [Candidatus Micrarchaeota archaeon]|nr:hypothetical protein [Candidatus Micrarchaeota archaeon]